MLSYEPDVRWFYVDIIVLAIFWEWDRRKEFRWKLDRQLIPHVLRLVLILIAFILGLLLHKEVWVAGSMWFVLLIYLIWEQLVGTQPRDPEAAVADTTALWEWLRLLRNGRRIPYDRTKYEQLRPLRNAGLIREYPEGCLNAPDKAPRHFISKFLSIISKFLSGAEEIEITTLGKLLLEASERP